MVEFRDVSYSVNGKRILHGLSFRVEAGETVALLGRSGSGKTTAMRLVNGLLHPDSGEVLVEGRSTLQWDAVRLKRRTGYVIQETGLFPHFTVERNIGLAPRLEGWPPGRIDTRVRELLVLMDLAPAEYLHRYPRELSGGQRQRVGVARALAGDPPLLLLDEPFGALDPVTRNEMQRKFVEITRRLQKTALFVTHDLREAMRVANRVALLHNGRLELIATPSEFLQAGSEEARAFIACVQ